MAETSKQTRQLLIAFAIAEALFIVATIITIIVKRS